MLKQMAITSLKMIAGIVLVKLIGFYMRMYGPIGGWF
jgi:hypothetical protein